MNGVGLIGILPIIVLAAASVVLMLMIAVKRDYQLAWRGALAGVVAALLSIPIAASVAPTTATDLMIVDGFALFFSALLLVTGAYVLIFSYRYFQVREGENEEFFLLILIALLGAVTMVYSNHFASFFVGLETLSVALFALIAYPVKQRRSLEAAFKYLVLSGVSSAFLLFGMALIYAETGTMAFAEMSLVLSPAGEHPYSLVGIIMILIALGFKLSLVPFHMWTPDIYQGAPAPVTAFVATVSKGAILAVWLRMFIAFGLNTSEALVTVMSLLAYFTIIVGNILALLQNNIKRMLAYSSIAHLGYILVIFCAGFSTDGELVSEAVMLYLVVYILTTLGSFGIVTALSPDNREAETLDDYTGLFWRHPLLAAQFTIMLLALAGIPLTAGFIAKFYVFMAGVQGDLWLLLWMVVIGSGFGLFYYLRIVKVMIKPRTGNRFDSNIKVSITRIEWIAQTLLTVIIIYLGVVPGGLIEMLGDIGRGIG